MADRDPNSEATGPEDNSGVETEGNDAFAKAFAAFASGQTPEGEEPGPKDGEEEEGAAAGQDGAERGSDDPPSEGDDNDPPANAPGDKPAAKQEAPDPWANATPEIIAEREKLMAELERTRRSDEGSRRRASGLQRRLNELTSKSAAEPPKEEGGEDKGKKGGDAWQALDDKIKQIEEDYPEIAGVLVPLLKAQRDEIADLKSKVTPVIEADQAEAVAAAQEAIESRHKDWRNYGDPAIPQFAEWLASQPANVQADNKAFRGWLEAQPPKVQALADSWEPQEVAVALTLFKTERAEATKKAGEDSGKDAETDAKRRRQLDGGKAVTSKTGSVASGAPDDFKGAFEHFAQKQQASGGR